MVGLILLLGDASRALGQTHKTTRRVHATLTRALSEQLDWSLDDLGFETSEVEDLRNGRITPELQMRLHAWAHGAQQAPPSKQPEGVG